MRAVFGASQIAGQAVQEHAQAGGPFGRVALRQQACQQARQHVAAAAGGHARIAGGVEPHAPCGRGDGRVCALQHDEDLPRARFFHQPVQSLEVILAFAKKAPELAGVGREDAVWRQPVEQVGVVGHEVEGVGIDHEGG